VAAWDARRIRSNVGLFEFAEGLLHLDAQRDGFAGPEVESFEPMWGYVDAYFYWDGRHSRSSCPRMNRITA
jgi:hypothetical protein